ncbi:MAG: ThiF family adenylyltransferase [Candidatus Thermoplasmatota archaeon]|nr:ThiF family adenylyltransferase [Candidatus Thermoplasmatota archaeon]
MPKELSYEEIFQRNYGIFTSEEQERIKKARVIIVGCGGVGGTVSIELCRSGVEHFMLVEPDVYSDTNMNRQISCYTDTLGKNKAEALKKDIARINGKCEIEVVDSTIPLEHLEQYLKGYDVLISSADDFAYSIVATRIAKRIGIPSVIGFPVGSLARIWTSTPGSPDIEDYFALPKNEPDYRALHEALYGAKGRLNYARWAQRRCSWSAEWASGYASSKLSLSQIAPVVWLTSSLVSLEALKCITHKWEPVVFPRYWKITPTSAGIEELKPHQ